LGQNLGVFPLEQTSHVGVAKSEHPRLTNDEIIFEEFQPMWLQFTNVTDRQTDRRTDRQTTCNRNTALCTKVHRAVKSSLIMTAYEYDRQLTRTPTDVSTYRLCVSLTYYLNRLKIMSLFKHGTCTSHITLWAVQNRWTCVTAASLLIPVISPFSTRLFANYFDR